MSVGGGSASGVLGGGGGGGGGTTGKRSQYTSEDSQFTDNSYDSNHFDEIFDEKNRKFIYNNIKKNINYIYF